MRDKGIRKAEQVNSTSIRILVCVILALLLFMLILIVPAIGQSGDYGVVTGASAGCGHTHYCTATPQGNTTPAPTYTMMSLSVNPSS